MTQPIPADASTIIERFLRIAAEIDAMWDDDVHKHQKTTPAMIIQAMEELQQVLIRLIDDHGEQLLPRDITRCSEYGLQLISEMSSLASVVNRDEEAQQLEDLCLPFALWSSRFGAEIATLEPVVNAIARIANGNEKPAFLEEIYREVSEIVRAVHPDIQQDIENSNPMRPWRILLINRAIVATRSHQPMLMDDAFTAIVENFPEDAPRFFREGMEQMDIVGYPMPVREVMLAWFQRYSDKQTLH